MTATASIASTPTNTTMTTRTYKFSDLRKRQALFIDGLINAGYSGNSTSRRAVVATAASLGYPDSFPWPSWLTADLDRRTARGVRCAALRALPLPVECRGALNADGAAGWRGTMTRILQPAAGAALVNIASVHALCASWES